jgi:hypothetical protein
LRFKTQEKFANIWQVLIIKTVIPQGFCYHNFVFENKQGNQYNGANLLRKFVSKKLSIIDPLWRRRTLAIYDSTDIVAKKPQPGGKKETPWTLAYNAKV